MSLVTCHSPTTSCLVTGSSGFVGRHLVQHLAASGHWGIAVSRSERYSTLPSGWQSKVRADVLGEGGETAPVDAVVHLEVKQHVPQPTGADVAEFHAVNVEGTQAWLDWCACREVRRFVYLSSIKAVQTLERGATDESAAGPHPSAYGSSKWAAEQRVRAWVAADARRSALILRPAVIYGPGNTANVAAMVSAIRRGRFFLVGRNDNPKSLVGIRNVVSAVSHLLERMVPGTCEVYNLVDAQTLTVRELDARIRQKFGKSGNSPSLPLSIAKGAAWFGDSFYSISGRHFPINSTRLQALLETTHFSGEKLKRTGFVHPQSIDDGLAEMIRAS